MSYEIVDLLNHINANGTTVVMVTHEHNLVRHFHHRVITIEQGAVVSDSEDTEALPDDYATIERDYASDASMRKERRQPRLRFRTLPPRRRWRTVWPSKRKTA